MDRVRLSAQLYSEHLLDRTVFLDWCLTVLDNATLDNIPFALLIINLYWKDMMLIRRTGQHLVRSLLEKAHSVCTLLRLCTVRPTNRGLYI